MKFQQMLQYRRSGWTYDKLAEKQQELNIYNGN